VILETAGYRVEVADSIPEGETHVVNEIGRNEGSKLGKSNVATRLRRQSTETGTWKHSERPGTWC
jgi:hypothetical protein